MEILLKRFAEKNNGEIAACAVNTARGVPSLRWN
jgi:hypothetical protein